MKKKFLPLAALILLSALMLLPVYWTTAGAFLNADSYAAHYASTSRSPAWLPLPPVLTQFVTLMEPDLLGIVEYAAEFLLSVKITLIILLIHIPVAVLLGYVLAKVPFRGKSALFFLIILAMLAPLQVTLTPTLIISRELGLQNSWWSILLPAFVMPFGIFLMRQFIIAVPDEVLEATRLETESLTVVLLRIIVPMTLPACLTLIILTFAESWNMVEQPMLMLESAYIEPLSLSLNDINRLDGHHVFAASLLYMLPILILYIFLRRHLIQSLTEMQL